MSLIYRKSDCCCGKPTIPDGHHPTPCFVCRALADTCECCGAVSPGGDGYYPYGHYCKACGEDITHPTGYGWCFVVDGKEHRSAKPEGWTPDA